MRCVILNRTLVHEVLPVHTYNSPQYSSSKGLTHILSNCPDGWHICPYWRSELLDQILFASLGSARANFSGSLCWNNNWIVSWVYLVSLYLITNCRTIKTWIDSFRWTNNGFISFLLIKSPDVLPCTYFSTRRETLYHVPPTPRNPKLYLWQSISNA